MSPQNGHLETDREAAVGLNLLVGRSETKAGWTHQAHWPFCAPGGLGLLMPVVGPPAWQILGYLSKQPQQRTGRVLGETG